jgi:predicted SAM-dependent methyltransferase
MQEILVSDGRTRWLDVGSGGKLDDDFEYLDVFPTEILPEHLRTRYHRADVRDLSDRQYRTLGRFDLVRLQHTLEHLTFEEGARALSNCARLLRDDGSILITAPDLRVHISRYLAGYQNCAGYVEWARERVPADAPPSAYFSVFAHSMTYEPHKWCYDFEGIAFQLERTGLFADIQQLSVHDDLASVPFTHNRPDEDVCVVARRKR